MQIVVDASAILAVILGEPERERLQELTRGNELIGPASVHWEIGNAFSRMLKRKRIQLREAQAGMSAYQSMQIRYLDVDMFRVLALAHQAGMYAYDAYLLDCCLRQGAPLLTLDGALQQAAQTVKIRCLEV